MLPTYSKVTLKPGKDAALHRYHPWIFSGALKSIPKVQPGELCAVYNAKNDLLGYAYLNPNCSLIGRMVSFGEMDPLITIRNQLKNAIQLRNNLFSDNKTNAYRLVNAEGDALPGVIVDRYDTILVIQCNTAGAEKLKPLIVEILVEQLKPAAIYEKSSGSARQIEGLSDQIGWIYEKGPDTIEIKENELKFKVNLINSQKTGLFLDQREMRTLVETQSKNRKVLNCFGYTGGFSMYALRGGAKQADTLDISANAIAQAKHNIELNSFPADKAKYFTDNAFEYLHALEPKYYDFIILDPPAFAKKAADKKSAFKAYQSLNRLALQKLASNGLLLTCSCSYYIDQALFYQSISMAAQGLQRSVRILSEHRQALDHPISLFHPEGRYLKSLLLAVD